MIPPLISPPCHLACWNATLKRALRAAWFLSIDVSKHQDPHALLHRIRWEHYFPFIQRVASPLHRHDAPLLLRRAWQQRKQETGTSLLCMMILRTLARGGGGCRPCPSSSSPLRPIRRLPRNLYRAATPGSSWQWRVRYAAPLPLLVRAGRAILHISKPQTLNPTPSILSQSGVPHPPGYPLLTMAGSSWLRLSNFLNVGGTPALQLSVPDPQVHHNLPLLPICGHGMCTFRLDLSVCLLRLPEIRAASLCLVWFCCR